MAKLTKKQKIAYAKVDQSKLYSLKEAAALVKEITNVNFDASVDIAVRLGVDPRKANQMVRGVVTLPHGTGKDVRVLALVTPDKEEEAKAAGADYVGLDEYVEKIKAAQTDKDGNLVVLYAAHKEGQHGFIKKAENKGYDVLVLEGPLVSHLMQKLEGGDHKVKFARVDSDSIEKLIPKDEENVSLLTEEQKEKLKPLIEEQVDKASYTVVLEALDSKEAPFTITVPEFMRRMKEMSATGGGMMGMGDLPDMYNLIVNTNHPLATRILETEDEGLRNSLIQEAKNLAMLAQNLLHGEALTNFVEKQFEAIAKN